MKYIIIAICIILILLAVYILVLNIRKSLKGKCCEGCKGCSVKEQCRLDKKDEN